MALETLFHMTEMQAHEDRAGFFMLQICPVRFPTTNFDPSMFDSSPNEQWQDKADGFSGRWNLENSRFI